MSEIIIIIGLILLVSFILEIATVLYKQSRPKPEYKRYMVFGFDQYESGGGISDCVSDFDKLEDAILLCKSKKYDYFEILDRVKGVEVEWK